MKSKELDQFYTKPDIAKDCYDKVIDFLNKRNIALTTWLEPSAGCGAFYSLLSGDKLGIDLDPKLEGIICHDFLTYPLKKYDYLTIGNPPFGKNSSLAVKFFNKCADHSLLIAFIVPKTFKKHSIKNKLNKNFHLEYEYDLPDYSFAFNDKDYNVPSVLQIWLKSDIVRNKTELLKTHTDFVFTNKENADFAIQRVGMAAGKVKENFIGYACASHYFIKAINNKDIVLSIFNKIDYNSVKYNTAGNPSISKNELIELYQLQKNNLSNL